MLMKVSLIINVLVHILYNIIEWGYRFYFCIEHVLIANSFVGIVYVCDVFSACVDRQGKRKDE